MSNSVWMVTNGEHYELEVIGLFSTEEKAKRATEFYTSCGEYFEVEVDSLEDPFPGLQLYRVQTNFDTGDVDYVSQVTYNLKDKATERPGQESYALKPVSGLVTTDRKPILWLSANVWATDEKHAIKIVNESRLMLKADQAFLKSKGLLDE